MPQHSTPSKLWCVFRKHNLQGKLIRGILQYLMTYYLFLADRHGTASGARWAIMGIAVKLGQSVSLTDRFLLSKYSFVMSIDWTT
jgi:hypothetical protein